MKNDEGNNSLNQLSEFVKAELLRRQSEVEKETGIKPELQDLFEELKGEMLRVVGLEKPVEHDEPPPAHILRMQGALPGLQKTEFHTSFIPDIPLLLHWKKASAAFYTNEYSKEEAAKLHSLYLQPEFQRLSYTLEGRLAMIAHVEKQEQLYFPKEEFDNFIDYYCELEKVLNKAPENYSALATDFIERYGKKYGTRWLIHNQPPLSKSFLADEWQNGQAIRNCWWKYEAPFVADEYQISIIVNAPANLIETKLAWMSSLPKFKKLSRSIQGRMDLICSIELCPKENMLKRLGLSNYHFSDFDEHEEYIRERFVEEYGLTYGSIWVAYGLSAGVDHKFIFLAWDSKCRFLDRVPALFRFSPKRIQILEDDEPESEELNGTEAKPKRHCLRCGTEIKGRSDKLFCGGACQRTYHRHQFQSEELNGIPETPQKEVAHEEKRREPGFMEMAMGILKEPAELFLNNAAEKISKNLFGDTKVTESNNQPVPPFKCVSGDELNQIERNPGGIAFSPEFTRFFGKLHLPFKMLVWGLPGQGKSSFCLQFCNAICKQGLPGTYISAEEDPEGDTMLDKIDKNCSNDIKSINFISWLPSNQEQWVKTLYARDKDSKLYLNSFYLVYDSVSKLEQKPGLADRIPFMVGDDKINEVLSHIYISHAEKDGSTYAGEAAWEHEADIVIKIHQNKAVMMKNRFKTNDEGVIGGEFDFFKGRV